MCDRFVRLLRLIPYRFVTCGMIGLTCVVLAIIRSCMSIIILAMTKNPYDPAEQQPDYGVRYEWSTYEQSLVLGSYFWGNTIICSFAGVFAERYGARYILASAFAISAMLSALSPTGAQFLWSTILIRLLTGIAMGTVFPSLHALIAKWSPPEERGKFLSMLNFTGIGAVIDWSMSGYIIEQYGWKYTFYAVTAIFGIFTVLLLIFVYDSPSKHPWIKENEKELILSKLSASISIKKPWPPIRSILTSAPFWALLCFHFGDMCGFYLLLTSVPRYLSEVHSFTITSTGLYASVPYLTIVPVGIIFGLIGDFLLKRKFMSANAIRKWFSVLSHFIPGCFLACITFVADRPYLCLAFITIALGFNASVVITSIVNPHDLSPNFAPTIYGLISLFGSSAGYLTPLLVAYFTEERSTEEEWQKLFFVGAGIFIGSNLIFVVFGSGHVQKWNRIDNEGSTATNLNKTEMNVFVDDFTKSENTQK